MIENGDPRRPLDRGQVGGAKNTAPAPPRRISAVEMIVVRVDLLEPGAPVFERQLADRPFGGELLGRAKHR